MSLDRDAAAAVDYDRSSRHEIVARLLAQVVPPGGLILDIGGSEGLTAALLDGRRVVSLDISDRARVDVRASAGAIPFAPAAFDAVVGLDLLEHVPKGIRADVISEAVRVARRGVVFAGPYADDAVHEAEAAAQAIFRSLFDQDNPWLVEHAEMGLPELGAVRDQLADAGLTVSTFGSNPIPIWSAIQEANFYAARTGGEAEHEEINRQLFHEFLDQADTTPPSYRHFVVATRDGSRPDGGTAGDEAAIAPWVAAIRTHMAAVVNAVQQRQYHFNAELQQGWRDSARLAEAAHMSMTALEQAVLEQEHDWFRDVRGPVMPDDLPLGPAAYQEQYDGWTARHSWAPAADLGAGPEISILVPVFNPDPRHLEACIRSVRAQTYDRWQLVLADASTAPHVAPICRRFALLDPRITVLSIDNQGIAGNTNRAAEAATAPWLAFMDHDDVLAPHALAAVVDTIVRTPGVEFVYSDEDKLDADDRRVEPFFKPDWSPELLRTLNYIGHLVAVTRPLFDRLGGIRAGFDGAQDYEFNLRATAAAAAVAHVPEVLYHWRHHAGSTATAIAAKPYAHSANRRALQSFCNDSLPGAWVGLGPGPTSHRLRHSLTPQKLSVIVPFRDGAAVTDACLSSIERFPPGLPFEVLLVSNNSTDPKTFDKVDEWVARWPWVRASTYDHPFNFQSLNNWAAGQVDGELLLFLNNDTEAFHHGWAEALAEHAQQPDIGAVGPRLFYPDGRVQHAGVAVGIGGLAEHPWARVHPESWTPAGPSYWVRDFLSVTAACLMVDHGRFDEVHGLDERFIVCGGDVDLGLRLHEAGYRNVMTPFARLMHHESVTRERHPPQSDVDESLRAYARYLAAGDPFYNPNLTRLDTSCSIAPA